jgi:hypothetical protein
MNANSYRLTAVAALYLKLWAGTPIVDMYVSCLSDEKAIKAISQKSAPRVLVAKLCWSRFRLFVLQNRHEFKR